MVVSYVSFTKDLSPPPSIPVQFQIQSKRKCVWALGAVALPVAVYLLCLDVCKCFQVISISVSSDFHFIICWFAGSGLWFGWFSSRRRRCLFSVWSGVWSPSLSRRRRRLVSVSSSSNPISISGRMMGWYPQSPRRVYINIMHKQ